MRVLFIMTVFLILVWFTDGSHGLCCSKKSNSRRAFFSKRSFPSSYEENTKSTFFSKRSFPSSYEENTKSNCAIKECLPGMEECTNNNFKRRIYQFRDERERKNLEKRCVILFANCAAKCMNNW